MISRFIPLFIVLASLLFLPNVNAKVGDTFVRGQLKYTVLVELGSIGAVEVIANSTNLSANLTIPDSVANNGITYSVTSIGKIGFHYCNNLVNVKILGGVNTIGDRAFQFCKALKSVELSDSVTSIGDGAFNNCDNLVNVVLPSSLTSIGDTAFNNCHNLVNITLPSDLTSIGNGAFQFCSSLTSITIPASVTKNAENIFGGNSNLENIFVTDGNPSYSSKDGVLYNKNKTILFKCPEKKKGTFVVPTGVTTINGAFYGCHSLTSITLPASITSIGGAFLNCTNLTSVNIPEKVTSIGESTFMNSGITNIIIPNNVTSIGQHAFSYCSNLESITIGDKVSVIEDIENLLYGTPLFYETPKLTSINVSARNSTYSSEDGVLFNKSKTTLIQCPQGKVGTYIIPASVTSIKRMAFFECRSLACVIIPKKVSSIESGAFFYCSNLRKVCFEGNAPQIVSGLVNSSAFDNPSVIYYISGTTGWTNPWDDRPTAIWADAPQIMTQPQNQFVSEGEKVTFIVVATGTTPLKYQWKKDGTNISGATSASYTISSANANDAGVYTVTVSNSIGFATSSTAVLVVSTPVIQPSFTTQPKSQNVNEGSSVTFSVVATGTAPLTYQWKKNGSNISGATSDSYTISNVKSSDAGSYTVTVSNSAGSVTSSAATLTVNVVTLSSISISGNNSVNVGNTATYTCTATYSNGTSKTVTPIWSISAGTSYASITSAGVLTGKAAGTATIQAKYTEGGVTKTVTKNVTINAVVVKPSITTQPKSQTVNEGSSVTFDVTATGTDPLSYQWKKDGSNISGATSASYTISSAKTSDAGSYTVTVSNSAGSVTSSTATLTVTAKPTITVQPQNQTIKEGNAVTFSVTVTGAEPLSYQWYKNGFVLSGATENQYTIASVAESDAGQYFVIVSNSAGSVVSETASLVVTVPPVIVKQPESLSVLDGEEALFSVEAERATKYQWCKDSEPINGATNAVYRIANTVMDDMGEYYVLVENEYHSVQSDTVILEVYRLPVITKQPAGVSVSGGESATFNVEAENVTVYQWYKNGLAIAEANESSYTIEAVNGYNVGEYSVVVSNEKASIVSDVVTLGISEAYRASAEPQIANGFVIGFVVTDPGWGYDFVPKVRVKDEFGEGAEAHCIVENGMIVGIVVDNPGSGYSEETYVKVGSPYKFNSLSIKVTEVEITMFLNLGELYQLESTVDHITWEKVGEPFIAEDEEVKLRLEVVDWVRYFRVHEVK